ncbi:MAG TPA: hypothetical protein VEB64_14640 [Azospirillaceae bacterium]|nr:hypothetical protein [Azospirillaceae bacterium]
MALIFVARSATLTDWASDVGLGKHVYKVGIAADKEAMDEVVAQGWAGEGDWKVVKSEEVADVSEEDILARLSAREKAVDPAYYPRIKDARGLFRVNLPAIEKGMILEQAMSGVGGIKALKAKPTDVATYLIRNALG